MVKFLRFVKADLAESTQDFEDDFVDCLQKSVQSIKENRELEVHFMGWYEMLRDERAEVGCSFKMAQACRKIRFHRTILRKYVIL